MSNTIICKIATGADVYYTNGTSHTATHLADTPQVLPLVVDFLSK